MCQVSTTITEITVRVRWKLKKVHVVRTSTHSHFDGHILSTAVVAFKGSKTNLPADSTVIHCGMFTNHPTRQIRTTTALTWACSCYSISCFTFKAKPSSDKVAITVYTKTSLVVHIPVITGEIRVRFTFYGTEKNNKSIEGTKREW